MFRRLVIGAAAVILLSGPIPSAQAQLRFGGGGISFGSSGGGMRFGSSSFGGSSFGRSGGISIGSGRISIGGSSSFLRESSSSRPNGLAVAGQVLNHVVNSIKPPKPQIHVITRPSQPVYVPYEVPTTYVVPAPTPTVTYVETPAPAPVQWSRPSTNTPPKVVANEVDVPQQARRNDAGRFRASLRNRDLDQAENELEDARDEATDDVAKEIDDLGMTNDQIDDLVAQAPPDKRQAIREAARDARRTGNQEDMDRLERALRAGGINDDNVIRNAQDRAGVSAAERRYRDAVADGNAGRIADARQNLEDQVSDVIRNENANPDAVLRNRLRRLDNKMDQTERIVAALDAVQNANSGANVLANGPVTVVYVPSLPAGDVALIADDVVLAGVGANREVQVLTEDAESLSQTLGVPLFPGEPVAAIDPSAATSSGTVVENPAETSGAVNFIVNETNYSLEAGYLQRFDAVEGLAIKFDRGANQGAVNYGLEAGTYQFGIGKEGWDLWKVTYTTTIDNSANPKDFHFVFNNEQYTARAGKALKLQCPYMPIVHFDQGAGGEPAARRLKTGVYRVGVAGTGLDLFAATSTPVARSSGRDSNAMAGR